MFLVTNYTQKFIIAEQCINLEGLLTSFYLFLKILREVIAINQDKLGKQGRLIHSSSFIQHGQDQRKAPAVNTFVFARPLEGDAVAVALLNTYQFAAPRNFTISFKEVRD